MGVQLLPSDVIRLRLRQALIAALEEIGGRITDSLAVRLNDPAPPSSTPGESPHRRTGLLRAGVGHSVDQTDTGARCTIYAGREGDDPNIPLYLEFGTSKGLAARPFMTPARDEWAAALPSELTRVYQERFANVSR